MRHLLERCTFPSAGTPVVCAVSGGPDSTALLVLACAAGLQVEAVHVDHGLRPESAGEAAVVEATAARFGASFRAVAVHVGAGPNLEARARTARYAQLPPDVLTGHTADDQAETVLINLLRGSGTAGLAGMAYDAAYCAAKGGVVQLTKALADGQIDDKEQAFIEAEAKRLHVTKEEVDRLLERARRDALGEAWLDCMGMSLATREGALRRFNAPVDPAVKMFGFALQT